MKTEPSELNIIELEQRSDLATVAYLHAVRERLIAEEAARKVEVQLNKAKEVERGAFMLFNECRSDFLLRKNESVTLEQMVKYGFSVDLKKDETK